jgi:hypothetical protein
MNTKELKMPNYFLTNITTEKLLTVVVSLSILEHTCVLLVFENNNKKILEQSLLFRMVHRTLYRVTDEGCFC